MASKTFQDAPAKPVILQMTLKEKSMWQKFQKSTKGFTSSKLVEIFDTEKQKLLDQVKSGRQLTQEQCDFLNESTRENIKRVLPDFQQKALAQMEFKTTDSADEIQFKASFGDQCSLDQMVG